GGPPRRCVRCISGGNAGIGVRRTNSGRRTSQASLIPQFHTLIDKCFRDFAELAVQVSERAFGGSYEQAPRDLEFVFKRGQSARFFVGEISPATPTEFDAKHEYRVPFEILHHFPPEPGAFDEMTGFEPLPERVNGF